MKYLISSSFFDKCVDLLSKIFASQWVVATVCLGGFALVYLLCLLPSVLGGDFVTSKKAVKMIARGDVESGLKLLNKRAPAHNQNGYPPASAFDYDKIIAHPYSYSFVKKLPMVVIGLTLFFAAVAIAAAVAVGGELNGFAALILIAVAAVGLLLFVISALISGESLRRAAKRYHAMVDYVKDITVTPAEVEVEKPTEQAIDDLCLAIEQIAVIGGANYDTLSGLYSQINALIQKAPSPALAARLAAAIDVLDLLVESAIQK